MEISPNTQAILLLTAPLIVGKKAEPAKEGRLVMVSAYDPSAGFNVGHAMQRNKTIYAMSDAGLVVTSDFQKGGTWTGAIEHLEKLKLVPVFVRNGPVSGKGKQALIQHGGVVWPEPKNGVELADAICRAIEERSKEPQQESLGLRLREDEGRYGAEGVDQEGRSSEKGESVPGANQGSPSERLLASVSVIIMDLVEEPRSDKDLSELLNVSKAQVQAWLRVLQEQGVVEKLSKPVRYQVANADGNLL